MNCLRRIDSEEELMRTNDLQDYCRPNFSFFLGQLERSFSGSLARNLRPKPDYDKMRSHSTLGPSSKPGPAPHGCGQTVFESGPRLVRSSGMRRDWSFEDLQRTVKG